jgi:hypothetical protein
MPSLVLVSPAKCAWEAAPEANDPLETQAVCVSCWSDEVFW